MTLALLSFAGAIPIVGMAAIEKLQMMIGEALQGLPSETYKQTVGLLTSPEFLAIVLAMAAIQSNPEAAAVVNTALLVAALAVLGSEACAVLQELAEIMAILSRAKTCREISQAAEKLKQLVARQAAEMAAAAFIAAARKIKVKTRAKPVKRSQQQQLQQQPQSRPMPSGNPELGQLIQRVEASSASAAEKVKMLTEGSAKIKGISFVRVQITENHSIEAVFRGQPFPDGRSPVLIVMKDGRLLRRWDKPNPFNPSERVIDLHNCE